MKLGWTKKDRVRGWTAVDSGPEGVFAVSVRPSDAVTGKPQVVKCGFMPDTELNADVLSHLSRQITVSQFQWTLPLNRSDYQIMVIPEPPVQPAEMEQSVRWQLGTMIDYPAEEANVAWMSIPTKEHLPHRPPHIYVIVARSDVVRLRAEPFRQAKLPLQAVDIHETAQRNIAALFEKPGEGLGVVWMSNHGVQITFTFEGELFLDRFIDESLASVVDGDDDNREKVFDRVVLQVQRSIDLVNRMLPFMTVGRILVAPLPAPIALRDHLARNINEPVETMELGSVFDFSLVPELRSEENQARFFTALGAALRGRGKSA